MDLTEKLKYTVPYAPGVPDSAKIKIDTLNIELANNLSEISKLIEDYKNIGIIKKQNVK